VSYLDGIVARNCCSGVVVLGIVIGILHLLRLYPVNFKVSTPIPFPSSLFEGVVRIESADELEIHPQETE